MRLALLILVAAAGTARAGEHDEMFAKEFAATPAQVHDVAAFEIPAGNDMSRVVIGRFDYGKSAMTGVLLVRCEAECTSRRVELGTADKIEVAGIVDLEGAPTAIRLRGLAGPRLPGARAMKFPVLAVVTRETRSRAKLYLISLLEADRGSVVFMDTTADRELARSYRLDKGDPKGPLELVVTERRKGCEPGEQVFSIEEHHFRTKKYTPGKGC